MFYVEKIKYRTKKRKIKQDIEKIKQDVYSKEGHRKDQGRRKDKIGLTVYSKEGHIKDQGRRKDKIERTYLVKMYEYIEKIKDVEKIKQDIYSKE